MAASTSRCFLESVGCSDIYPLAVPYRYTSATSSTLERSKWSLELHTLCLRCWH